MMEISRRVSRRTRDTQSPPKPSDGYLQKLAFPDRRRGWRPTIGWVCALALAWAFILQPVAVWAVATFALGAAVPAAVTEHLLEMVLAMLGIAGLRTFEKTKAR
jgi:hypothetical protein